MKTFKEVQQMFDKKELECLSVISCPLECKVYFVDNTAGGRIICTAEATRLRKTMPFYFNRLFVSDNFRNCGLATAAVKMLFNAVQKQEFPVIHLDINPYVYQDKSYSDLEMFYTKLGFKRAIIKDGQCIYRTFYHADESLIEKAGLDIFKAGGHGHAFKEKAYVASDMEINGETYSGSGSWFDEGIALWDSNGSGAVQFCSASVIDSESSDEVCDFIHDMIEYHKDLFRVGEKYEKQ